MKLTSTAFENNTRIPEMFSFEEGDCINPELCVDGAPSGTKSFVLAMDDIDAPGGSFIHWLVFDIPANISRIEQDSIPGIQAKNSAKRKNYTGPRTPYGSIHRYVFTLYALDTVLGLPEGTDKDIIIQAMKGHIRDIAQLTGTYSRIVPVGAL
jgi:Raf kinase inhibitor-like YbhB/YbcL family protein